jgi:hypothetical protein
MAGDDASVAVDDGDGNDDATVAVDDDGGGPHSQTVAYVFIQNNRRSKLTV